MYFRSLIQSLSITHLLKTLQRRKNIQVILVSSHFRWLFAGRMPETMYPHFHIDFMRVYMKAYIFYEAKKIKKLVAKIKSLCNWI